MNKTLKIAFSLKNTYRVNTILYSLKQIPLIKRLFPQELYRDPDFKIFANIISGIWEFLKAFLGKFLYFLFMLTLAVSLYEAIPARQTFLHIFVCLTLIGAKLNTYIFNPTKDKYYALMLLRMDAREYALATYGYEMIKILAGFLIFGVIFGRMRGLLLWQCLLLPVAAAGIKLTVVAYSLRKYERTGIAANENQLGVGGWILTAAVLAAAYGLPAAAVLRIPVVGGLVLPESVSIGILICGVLAGILSCRKIWIFREYREVYQQILMQYLHQVEEAKSSVKRRSEKAIQIEEGTGSSRKGFEYLNELFIKRHQKILWKSSKKIALISLGIVCASILGITLWPESKEHVNEMILTMLPYFVFVMYCINRGTGFTNVLFMNCDHSLLTYSFYKRPECILKLFRIRLREIMKVNLLPAFVIGAGLAVLLYLSGGTKDPLNYVMLVVSILCMSAFFSMHYLTIYYLLQPYNAGTEIKSGTYRVVVIVTYLFCYGFMQLRMPTFVFGLAAILFCVVYCIAACVLVYKLAPKTFKLRS